MRKMYMYERFTNPTPHSFVTLSSTTKLGLELPNKVISTCVLRKLELDESKKEQWARVLIGGFSSSFVRVCESDWSGIKQETVLLWVLWAVLLFTSYILPLRLFETLLARHIYKSMIVEFNWKLLSFFFSLPRFQRSRACVVRVVRVVRALAYHRYGPGSNPGVHAICGSEFVVSSLPCTERLFIWYSGFPLSLKTNTSKFNSIWNEWTRLNEFIRTPKSFVGKQITIYNLQSLWPFHHLARVDIIITG